MPFFPCFNLILPITGVCNSSHLPQIPSQANYEAFTVPFGPAPMLAVKGSVRLTLRPRASTGGSAVGDGMEWMDG